MIKLLEEALKHLGYEKPHVINGDNSSFTKIVIRRSQFDVICTVSIDNTLLFDDDLNKEINSKLKTLLYNDVWFIDGSELDNQKLEIFIEANYPSDEPDEKILRILNYIRSHTKFDGQKLKANELDLYSEDAVRKLYLYNAEELEFYVRSLFKLEYVNYISSADHLFHDLYITATGLNKIITENEKTNSKHCFVAMSFDSALRYIYDKAILPAIKESGFDPLRVDDDSNIPNELTINDAMLAGIKKAKFIIADFTGHKKGVYFEAGYALGRGLKVIYTCREDQINDAHFDTRNYPHIVWKDEEDLKRKLLDKIEVFIKA